MGLFNADYSFWSAGGGVISRHCPDMLEEHLRISQQGTFRFEFEERGRTLDFMIKENKICAVSCVENKGYSVFIQAIYTCTETDTYCVLVHRLEA